MFNASSRGPTVLHLANKLQRNPDTVRGSTKHLGPHTLRLLPGQDKKRSSTMTQHELMQATGGIDAVSQVSSSAESNVAKVRFGNRELETLKGLRVDKISPITRQLNIQTTNTLR